MILHFQYCMLNILINITISSLKMFYESEDDLGIKSETSQNNILLVLCCLYDKINFFELSI